MSIELARNLVRLIDDATPYRRDEQSLATRLVRKTGISLTAYLLILAPAVCVAVLVILK